MLCPLPPSGTREPNGTWKAKRSFSRGSIRNAWRRRCSLTRDGFRSLPSGLLPQHVDYLLARYGKSLTRRMHGVLLNLQQPGNLLKWCGPWPAWQLQLFPVRRFAGRLQSGSQDTEEAEGDEASASKVAAVSKKGEKPRRSSSSDSRRAHAKKSHAVPHRLDGEWAVPNQVCVRREEERCD